MIRQLCFDAGEIRHVQLKVKNITGKDFTISSAQCELFNKYEEKREVLTCYIDNHIIDTIISVPKAGYYELKYIYKIQDETLVDVIEIRVN